MTTEKYDICVVTLRHKAIIAPRSVVGMVWLQCHFSDETWKTLSEGSFLLNRADATEMVGDAEMAKLKVLFE